MAGDFRKIELGHVLSFANGRSSPPRANGLPFPVYGSNGIIGYAGEANADAWSVIIGRVGSYCGSLYLSKKRSWVTDNAI
jgi:type I restriction enzyme S subunit